MDATKIFEPFAKAGFYMKDILLQIEDDYEREYDPGARKILKKQISSLRYLIDRSFRVTGDYVPVGVSEMAKKYCDDNDLGDIFEIGWGEQAKFEKQKNRSSCKLKHEHKVPVKQLVLRLKDTNSIEEAIDVYLGQKIVWIHKDEDKKLPQSNRPDPDKAYEDAGIKVIENLNHPGHLFNK
ncbi:MAG: hypothetical protein KKA81_15220 [Bacteroidetes bacterium]|nr:hypothetical protein [Bacteroidota bacterium]